MSRMLDRGDYTKNLSADERADVRELFGARHPQRFGEGDDIARTDDVGHGYVHRGVVGSRVGEHRVDRRGHEVSDPHREAPVGAGAVEPAHRAADGDRHVDPRRDTAHAA